MLFSSAQALQAVQPAPTKKFVKKPYSAFANFYKFVRSQYKDEKQVNDGMEEMVKNLEIIILNKKTGDITTVSELLLKNIRKLVEELTDKDLDEELERVDDESNKLAGQFWESLKNVTDKKELAQFITTQEKNLQSILTASKSLKIILNEEINAQASQPVFTPVNSVSSHSVSQPDSPASHPSDTAAITPIMDRLQKMLEEEKQKNGSSKSMVYTCTVFHESKDACSIDIFDQEGYQKVCENGGGPINAQRMFQDAKSVIEKYHHTGQLVTHTISGMKGKEITHHFDRAYTTVYLDCCSMLAAISAEKKESFLRNGKENCINILAMTSIKIGFTYASQRGFPSTHMSILDVLQLCKSFKVSMDKIPGLDEAIKQKLAKLDKNIILEQIPSEQQTSGRLNIDTLIKICMKADEDIAAKPESSAAVPRDTGNYVFSQSLSATECKMYPHQRFYIDIFDPRQYQSLASFSLEASVVLQKAEEIVKNFREKGLLATHAVTTQKKEQLLMTHFHRAYTTIHLDCCKKIKEEALATGISSFNQFLEKENKINAMAKESIQSGFTKAVHMKFSDSHLSISSTLYVCRFFQVDAAQIEGLADAIREKFSIPMVQEILKTNYIEVMQEIEGQGLDECLKSNINNILDMCIHIERIEKHMMEKSQTIVKSPNP